MITNVDYCCSTLAGVSGSLLQRLQSVLNAAARLVFSARWSEHIMPLLREQHWLKVLERIHFRLCVLTHRCLRGTAPPYLADTLQSTADVQERCRLKSASTSTLVVPPTRRATVGDRVFPADASCAWNSHSNFGQEIQSQPAFRQKLKTTLFDISFPADWPSYSCIRCP